MKFSFSALIAIIVFLGVSVLTLDATTSYFGKPSQGISYGISMYYLAAAISITGSVVLISTKWFSPRLPLLFGVFSVFIWVIWLLPYPGSAIKSFVAITISLALVIDIMVLWSVTKKHHTN
jgi:hypothetical protein